MLKKRFHPFNISVKEAIELQKNLSSKVKIEQLKKIPQLVAGCDCSYDKKNDLIFGVVVILEINSFKIIEKKVAAEKISFPYIPGLLSFRETPVLIKAIKELKNKPDIFIIDGAGIMHPRKFGIASHIGYLFNIPSIGCAKSYLLGEYSQPENKKGSYGNVLHNGEEIGIVLRTRDNIKPLFVSVGHKITIEETKNLVLDLCRGYRIPEPIRIANRLIDEMV